MPCKHLFKGGVNQSYTVHTIQYVSCVKFFIISKIIMGTTMVEITILGKTLKFITQ